MNITARHIPTVWLIGVLAFATADPLWTLWRVPDDGNAERQKTGLEPEKCERLREALE
jgi:hypothetical protein